MTTLLALIEETANYVYGVSPWEHPRQSGLTTTLTTGSTTLVPSLFTMWEIGDYIELVDSTKYELVVVTALAAPNLTVIRGQRGSTAAATSFVNTSTALYKNPRHPRHEIEKAVLQVVRNHLWPFVWTWHRGTLEWDRLDTTYELPQFIHKIDRVYQDNISGDERYYDVPPENWDTELEVDTTTSSTGGLFRIKNILDESVDVKYVGRRRPDPADLANMSDEVAELVPWGAAWLLSRQRIRHERYSPTGQVAPQRETATTGDSREFEGMFIRLRDELARKLEGEVPAPRRYRRRQLRMTW